MSRTIRVDRRENCTVPDGKQSYQCRCEWCMSTNKKKAIKKLVWDNDLSIPNKIEAEEHYQNTSYSYYDDEYHDYTQHPSFIG